MSEANQADNAWRQLANTADNKKGSIHDDATAQKLGFKKAFVPGSVVANFAMPTILQHFGHAWLECGWYDFNFVSPVYIDEEVRTVCDDASGVFTCRIETRAGRLCAHGTAGASGSLPPLQTEGQTDDASVFPRAVLGTRFELDIHIRRKDAEPLLTASHDKSVQWRDCVPPEHLMPIALHMIDFKKLPTDGVAHPAMWAQHAISVHSQIHWDCDYHIVETLAEKGISGRTQYVTFQFHVFDQGDVEVAVGRHKCKFLRKLDGVEG
jgi:hypothetical protein